MELNINNFAKIEKADITIDGITVIAGENNTGKSTVGKILFSVFNSLSNVEEKVRDERLKEIKNTNRFIIQNRLFESDKISKMPLRMVFEMEKKINKEIQNIVQKDIILEETQVREILKNTVSEMPESLIVDASSEVCVNTSEILNLPEKTIIMEIVSRYFKNVFSSQIAPLSNNRNENSVVSLNIKEKSEILTFENSVCKEIDDNIKILHKAIYIDNPFIIDELLKDRSNGQNPMNQMLLELMEDGFTMQGRVMDGVIESVRAKEKLNEIYKILSGVIDGEIVINQGKEEFGLKKNGFSEPISLHNLSTGMKSFAILKMLLENGSLKEKDVVILDEPEIHLHPQWQIVYAELIVLLQKSFDLSVVVTTHSPYFVDAINLFSCKYGTDNQVNYYISENNDDTVNMKCVTDNIELIYKKMASPIQMLDTLRYELNNN